MPLVELPDGTYANFPDGTPPEVIARVRAQHSGPRRNDSTDATSRAVQTGARNAQSQMPSSMADRLVTAQLAMINPALAGLRHNSYAAPFERGIERGFTFGLNDEITGAFGALTGEGYSATRDATREQDRQFSDQHSYQDILGQVSGAMLNPIGRGVMPFKLAGNVLSRATSPLLQRAGTGSQAIAERLTTLPVPVQAAITGANQGALSGFGSADEDRLSGLLTGGIMGGITGGITGGATQGIQRGVQAFHAARPENAERIAFEQIARALESQPIHETDRIADNFIPSLLPSAQNYTPELAEASIQSARAHGTAAMLADLSPGLQAFAARTARRPEIPASNELIRASENRAAQRPGAMQEQIEQRFDGLPSGLDADAAQAANTAARRAHGEENYEGILDRNFVWNDDLENFFTKENPYVKEALDSAVRRVRGQDLDPRQLGFEFNSAGDITYVKVPNMRVFDYIKRGFDDRIGDALSRPNGRDEARIFSEQLDQLKQGIARSNPDYQRVLSEQRDFFQTNHAIEKGREVVKRLTGPRADPRILLSEIQQIKPEDMQFLRTGFADALMALRDQRTTGQGPIPILRAMMATPNQRKVLEALFDGKGNLGRFERWLAREVRAAKTDSYVAGPQSISGLMIGVQGSGQEGLSDVAKAALHGFGFGGPVGAAGNTVRAMDRLRQTIPQRPATVEAMARILMGDGTGLARGVNDARAYRGAQDQENLMRALLAAKGGQQIFTGNMGQ